MNPDRWRKVDSIFHKALEADDSRRAALLKKLCAGDEAVRREVESLLTQHRNAGNFMETPAFEAEASTAQTSSVLAAAKPRPNLVGTMVGQFRVLQEIGVGGMGVVYKAEDTKLGRPVALKFLPQDLAADRLALERFRREGRAASALNHPNICTIYDIVEQPGHAFIAMEYLEGQTLASHISGRALSVDRITKFGMPIAEALGAAHARGVIHRDIKPSNIFVTASGLVKVLDFGVAKLLHTGSERTVTSLTKTDAVAGTLPYMSPEQLRGLNLDARSDIYSLGVVLYEMSTGRRPYDGGLQSGLIDAILNRPPSAPRSINPQLPPKLQEIVLKCLEKDPEDRYQTAKEIAVDLRRMSTPALPGADLLAAVLAAGETPSPDLVAASGEAAGMRLALAWGCVAFVIAGILVFLSLSGRTKLYQRAGLEKPPEVLAERARDILSQAGHSPTATDTAFGFKNNEDFLRYITENDQSKTRWDNLDGAMEFWYRQSQRQFEPVAFWEWFFPGRVTETDPPSDTGMATVWLSPRGNLTGLLVVPPQVELASSPAQSPNWNLLFVEAGLDPAKWLPTTPQLNPPTYADQRMAWQGSLPERPSVPVRIEASAYRGEPVYFQLIGPWSRLDRTKSFAPTPGEKASQVLLVALVIAVLVGGVLLARHNLRLGRGDRRGAMRLAAAFFAISTFSWVFGASHVVGFYELQSLTTCFARNLFEAGFVWLVYIALEPHVRRRWPSTIVSWSRLLAGGLRDPLVGRDLLVGSVAATSLVVLGTIRFFLPGWLGLPPSVPREISPPTLLGGRHALSVILGLSHVLIFVSLGMLFLLVLLRILLRRQWAAVVVSLLLLLAIGPQAGTALRLDAPLLGAIYVGVSVAVNLMVLIRFGLVALIASSLFSFLFSLFPITPQPSAWYAPSGYAALAVVLAMLLYGFRVALAGRPLFGAASLED